MRKVPGMIIPILGASLSLALSAQPDTAQFAATSPSYTQQPKHHKLMILPLPFPYKADSNSPDPIFMQRLLPQALQITDTTSVLSHLTR